MRKIESKLFFEVINNCEEELKIECFVNNTMYHDVWFNTQNICGHL